MKNDKARGFASPIRSTAVAMALAAMALVGCTSGRARNGAVEAAAPGTAAAGEFRGSDIMEGDPFVGEGRRNAFDPVYFDYDSAAVPEGEREKVERVASAMRLQPRTSLVIEGHCDERGSSEYNLALGERRALAVRTYLMSMGIESDRVQTRSFGEETPARPGHAEEDWRLNRRGEFVVFGP